MNIRYIFLFAALFLVPSGLLQADVSPSPAAISLDPIILKSSQWQVQISPQTGGLIEITDPRDDHRMNWVHDKRTWGIVSCSEQGNKVTFDHPTSVTAPTPLSSDSTYDSANLKLTLHRSFDDKGIFTENYVFTNVGHDILSLPEGSVFITVPFNDSYESGAPKCLTNNCNTHLWAGGSSSWVNAIRMGGVGPHLGLVLTQGSLASYSILDGASSNDRGNLAFNPSAIELKPGESYTLSWSLFWHEDWDDFWAYLKTQPQFVRMQTAHYTWVQGQPIEVTAESASSLDQAVLTLNGVSVPVQASGNKLTARVKADHPGEYVFDLQRNGQHTWLKANVLIDPLALVKARVKFIVEKQQQEVPGDPLDGAYVAYDNETNQQSISRIWDHNEARERMGMGILVALYLPLCDDAGLKRELSDSLQKYETFLQRELMGKDGLVYNQAFHEPVKPPEQPGSDTSRHGYNYPWMAHVHLAAYLATKDTKYLDLFVEVCRALYQQRKGADYYEIGLPILDGLHTLDQAGRQSEHDELLNLFTHHADVIAAKAGNYPKSEVNYEQSIVGPGVQIELEMYLATKNQAYLDSARQQLVYLEAFNGQQPDYHLNDIAIRHWDDFWFGKLCLYGDTLPHYWSTITAVAFDEYADATGDESYRTRSRDIFLNNMCFFTPDGRGSCAYVYPAYLKPQKGDQLVPGNRLDPLANDQDFALVNWLVIYNRHRVP